MLPDKSGILYNFFEPRHLNFELSHFFYHTEFLCFCSKYSVFSLSLVQKRKSYRQKPVRTLKNFNISLCAYGLLYIFKKLNIFVEI